MGFCLCLVGRSLCLSYVFTNYIWVLRRFISRKYDIWEWNMSIETRQAILQAFLIICDALQQKVPYGPCYKLLLWYQFYSVTRAAVFSSQEVQYNYRLITAYLLLRVNLDKIMHARWDFDASSARTRRVSALDRHQNWSASALFCLNFRAQSK